MNKNKKIAVVLFNLGGPDSKAAIKPFLMNFFMDKNILPLPVPFRCILAWRIADKRSKREAGDSYGELGNQSPLLENSKLQAKALEISLNAGVEPTYKTFICMRYWHPMSPQVVREVRDWGADEILLLPLYPQFSTTTTWSSLGVWNKAMTEAGYERPTSMVCCYPFNDGFVQAGAENILAQYKQAQADGHKKIRILFSAHGLPESVIKGGDPYQFQCEESACRIAEHLNVILNPGLVPGEGSHDNERDSSVALLPQNDRAGIDWSICYQSRVGPKKWIGPSTEEEIIRAAKDGVAIIIYPHAFTQEHVETLVELDIEYRELAEEKDQHGYYRAATVGTHPAFIAGLADLVRTHAGTNAVQAEGGACLCPGKSGRCCMRAVS